MAEEGTDPPALRRLADVVVARATSGVAHIGFHTKATQKVATLEKNHLWTCHLVVPLC